MEAACLDKQYAWGNCTIGKGTGNQTLCLEDGTAMAGITKDPTDCASAKTMFDALKLNSTSAKDFVSCTMDACGCNAATIAKFGLVMLFGLIGYWFK